MPTSLDENLHDALKSVRTRLLFLMRLDVRKPQIVGATPGAFRRVGVITGGLFEGERLSGEVLEGGSDWQTVRSDGATTLNVRIVLKTNDDALIGMTYSGIRSGPPDILARNRQRRSARSHDPLFPHRPRFRDCGSAVQLDQQHHRGRHRPSPSRRADLQRVRSALTPTGLTYGNADDSTRMMPEVACGVLKWTKASLRSQVGSTTSRQQRIRPGRSRDW